MEKNHLLNNEIKSQYILLLGEDGEKPLQMSLREGLYRANEAEMDLMQVGENKEKLAICKILNYGSWLYHEKKRKEQQEKKNKPQELKIINFTPNIGDNDFQLKTKQILKFLEEGHKVKIVLKLRSREGAMKSVNDAVVQRIIEAVSERSVLDSKISTSFKEINFIVKPEKKAAPKMKP